MKSITYQTSFPETVEAVPRVSVVMPVYNAASFLNEAITSVLTQTFGDFELIVVDDASSDNSLEILRTFADPRIRIIQHKTNKGAALSRNDALAVARGEFVAIMDADDVCSAHRLQRQVTFLDAHPEIGVVGCALYDNIDECGQLLHRTTLPEDNHTIQHTLMERWCFLHSSLMFRKDLSEMTGGYRRIFEPVEDHDFVLRLVEYSQAHNLREPLVQYRLNPRGLTVMGRDYLEELSKSAICLAKARRGGRPEDLELLAPGLLKLKGMRRGSSGVARVMQRWRDSRNAAMRYYEIGRHELQVGDPKRAYRCFVQALRTNKTFWKTWLGLVVCFMTTLTLQLHQRRGNLGCSPASREET